MAVDRAVEAGCDRILVDCRQVHVFDRDPVACGEAADYLVERFAADTGKVAWLVNFDHQLDDATERMLAAKGVVNARFRDSDLALEWLAAPIERLGAGETAVPVDPVTLATRAIDPAMALMPSQFAAVVRFVETLLAEGLDEGNIERLAAETAHVLRTRLPAAGMSRAAGAATGQGSDDLPRVRSAFPAIG